MSLSGMTGAWVGDPITNSPNTPYYTTQQPQYVYHQWSAPMMGIDPNAGLIAAMNRLASALEKYNERKSNAPPA